MIFWYKALKDNKNVTGTVEANDEKEVIAYLRSVDNFPLEIKKITTSKSFFHKLFHKISVTDIAYFTRQLSIMLNSGLTLVDSIQIIKKQVEKPELKETLDNLQRQLKEGKSFSEALKEYPKDFSSLYISLIRSGEASGKLHLILTKLAENLEKEREFQQKIRNALIYPAVIFSAMILMMFIMITFVTPKLLELYKDFNVDLPFSTRLLISVSSFFATFWPFMLMIIGGLLFFFQNFRKTEKGKLLIDTFILRAPVIGNILKISSLVDATRTLSILIGSGVSILDGLNIVTDASNNRVYRNAFKNITKQVEKGISIGNAMINESIFPQSLIQMTTVGEQTGHLDETLLKVSEFYESESEIAIKGMLTLIEPAILVVLGVGVGFLVMAVITPIYSLSNSFQ